MPKSKKEKETVTVLHSGGMDSTAVIHFYKKMGYSITALFIDYGQVSGKYEKTAVEKICNHYKIKNLVVKVKSDILFSGGLITGRNLFLLSTALMYIKIKSGIIAIGIHAGTDYVDCGKAFIDNVNHVFTLYNNGKVIVGAPFINMSKSDIFEYSRIEGIPLHQTYSCERGIFPSCGKCKTCKEIKTLYDS